MTVRRFIEWLSFHPTSDEIARALVTDYLAEFAVAGLRFGRINSDDSAVTLGQFGYTDADEWRNKVIPSHEWRSYDLPETDIITGKNKDRWTPDARTCIVVLRDRGVMQGYSSFEFSKPIDKAQQHHILEAIEEYCVPISLYLSFQSRPVGSSMSGVVLPIDSRDAGNAQLSQRQILILRGMVEGKTNHELATELGFSVSTIRHETMRIYQALSVSDRKEAAKKALMLSLV